VEPTTEPVEPVGAQDGVESASNGVEGTARANGESTNEKTPQSHELQELVACLSDATERAGFEPAVQV
jgi:hypothetical protein